MKIAIHHLKGSFSERWIAYCESKGIEFKLVNSYRSDIVEQVKDCDAFMWHYNHKGAKESKFAKQLLFSLEFAGKKVFPDYNTGWHFDDKLGQKYLLEAVNAPLAKVHTFYSEKEAKKWAKQAKLPVVFKLRNGAGSDNVKLIKTRRQANRVIKKSFGKGFKQYDSLGNLKERIRKYRNGKTDLKDVLKGIVRILVPTTYGRLTGNEKGYVYFQEFIEGNDSDIRVVVVGDKAFAIKRLTRDKDFRASGSGYILYDKDHIKVSLVKLAFEISDKLKAQCIAFDFVYDQGNPILIEISYGFSMEGYDPCPGYWERNLNWIEGKFNPYGWMIENLIGT